MKKLLIGLFAFAVSAGAASAQDAPKNILGIRAGVNISNANIKEEGKKLSTDSRAGFHVGISEQLRIAPVAPLYFETGLYLTTKGSKESFSEEGFKGETKMNLTYLQLPVAISYHIPLGRNATLQPSVGIYYALGLSGKAKYEGSYDGHTYKESHKLFKETTITDEDGDKETYPQTLKRSDFGLRFGLGASFGRFYVGAGYDLGLSDIAKKNVGYDKIKTQNWTVSVGFNF